MKYRDQIEYGAIKTVMVLCRILPRASIYRLYMGFGSFFFKVGARRRNLTLKNLAIAFPEMDEAERFQLAKRTYRNISRSMAYNALLMSGRITDEELLATTELEEPDWERFKKATDSFTRGILVFSAHLGNWELLPQYAPLKVNKPVHVIARKLNNELLEERLVRPYRERKGQQVFYKKNALIGTVKAIKRGDLVGFQLDQKSSPQEGGIPLKFFGKESLSLASAALLQVRFGVRAIPAFSVYTERGTYQMIVGEPIDWEDNGKPQEEQVAELAQIHQDIIEQTVRNYPDQWFWMHNRWHLPKEEYR